MKGLNRIIPVMNDPISYDSVKAIADGNGVEKFFISNGKK